MQLRVCADPYPFFCAALGGGWPGWMGEMVVEVLEEHSAGGVLEEDRCMYNRP